MTDRIQTLGEEIANSISHGLALLAALVAAPFLLVTAKHLPTASWVGSIVFVVTMVLLYSASTIYHALPSGGRAKQVFLKLKAFDRLSHPWLSTGLYLLMGWLVLVAAVPLVERVPLTGVMLLVAGGLAYTLGVVFFMLDNRVRYAHAVWHAFVVAGSSFHFFAVLGYAA